MMGNRNVETKHQNVMLGWMAGMILLVAVLVLFILFHEPEPDGVTRAAAYKAAALAVTSYSDCVKEADQEPSFFFCRGAGQMVHKICGLSLPARASGSGISFSESENGRGTIDLRGGRTASGGYGKRIGD
ncbi:MAG: hypothetical protein V8S98_02160 [Lachnospiraceae bacterium]